MDHVDTSPGECIWPDSRERQISMARSLTEMRADFQHLRRWRKSVEQAQSYTFKAVITIIVSGFVGAVWLGVKVMLGK
jgi:ABC-type transporter Mla maintaining outer membrane lipid asymmetry permease subunit MlaE